MAGALPGGAGGKVLDYSWYCCMRYLTPRELSKRQGPSCAGTRAARVILDTVRGVLLLYLTPVSPEVAGPVITALARAVRDDIDSVWNAVKEAPRPQIHVGLSVSDIHIERKLRSNRAGVLRQGVEAVAYARSLCDQIQYSAEDAGRADRDYLCETLEGVIEAGANVINVPDTTGYNLPHEFGALIAFLCRNVRGIERAVVSIHCHNDLGLATANSIAALRNGARRVECTVNGIGERAGNAALEEVVMILRTREAELRFETGVISSKLAETSAMVAHHTGIAVQLNKAIV